MSAALWGWKHGLVSPSPSLPRRAQRYPPVLCPSQGSGTPSCPLCSPDCSLLDLGPVSPGRAGWWEVTPRERVQVGTSSRRTPGCGQSQLGRCSRLQGAPVLPRPCPLWSSWAHGCLLWPLSSGRALLSLAPQLLWGLRVGVVSLGKGVPGLPYLPTWSRGYF